MYSPSMISTRISAPAQSARWLLLSLMLGVFAISAGCATAPTDPTERLEYTRINDPLEPTNRAIFSFNTVFQALIVRPLAVVYNALPDPVQTAMTNFFTNLSEPRNIANALLQGDPDTAGTSLGRFLSNSSLGFGGLINVTGNANYNPRDFGQTLAQWTGGTGPYLELPFVGSSSLTAGIGMLVDGVYSIPKIQANRTGGELLPIATSITNGVRIYGQNITVIDNIRRTSPDPYSDFRNAYQQRRKAFIFGDDAYDFDDLDID